jgi:hypothetical protein
MRQQKATAAYSSFVRLAALLDEGWQIEPPIFVRPRWSSRVRDARTQGIRARGTQARPETEDTYHFVLRQGNRFSLVSVFDCPEVQQLLETEQLAVDWL